MTTTSTESKLYRLCLTRLHRHLEENDQNTVDALLKADDSILSEQLLKFDSQFYNALSKIKLAMASYIDFEYICRTPGSIENLTLHKKIVDKFVMSFDVFFKAIYHRITPLLESATSDEADVYRLLRLHLRSSLKSTPQDKLKYWKTTSFDSLLLSSIRILFEEMTASEKRHHMELLTQIRPSIIRDLFGCEPKQKFKEKIVQIIDDMFQIPSIHTINVYDVVNEELFEQRALTEEKVWQELQLECFEVLGLTQEMFNMEQDKQKLILSAVKSIQQDSSAIKKRIKKSLQDQSKLTTIIFNKILQVAVDLGVDTRSESIEKKLHTNWRSALSKILAFVKKENHFQPEELQQFQGILQLFTSTTGEQKQ